VDLDSNHLNKLIKLFLSRSPILKTFMKIHLYLFK